MQHPFLLGEGGDAGKFFRSTLHPPPPKKRKKKKETPTELGGSILPANFAGATEESPAIAEDAGGEAGLSKIERDTDKVGCIRFTGDFRRRLGRITGNRRGRRRGSRAIKNRKGHRQCWVYPFYRRFSPAPRKNRRQSPRTLAGKPGSLRATQHGLSMDTISTIPTHMYPQ